MSESTFKKQDLRGSSILGGLKLEWSLFWETLTGEDVVIEDADNKDPFLSGKLDILNLEQIKVMTKALSTDRKKLNQKLESLNKELDMNSIKLESLRLVGGDTQETVERINELSDLGQALGDQLDKINDRLRMTREREVRLKEELHF